MTDNKPALSIVKISGKKYENKADFAETAADFHALAGYKILSHGAGVGITEELKKPEYSGLALPNPPTKDGLRITPAPVLEVVEKVVLGINEDITNTLNGFCDGRVAYVGHKKTGILVNSEQMPKAADGTDFGFVGKIYPGCVCVSMITEFLRNSLYPVIHCLTSNKDRGGIWNTNADHVAEGVARELGRFFEVVLYMLSDVSGVLDADKEIIPEITKENYPALKAAGVITDGMAVKCESMLNLVAESNISKIIITNRISNANRTIVM
ncbi:MAG: hypothetical protein LBG89_01500 [Rickettsiales bacterium]|jgi:acetylglutamate kinase|nr:hypothetical protein [Rickettsiales bacterium]